MDEEPDSNQLNSVSLQKPKSKKKWLWLWIALILAVGLVGWFILTKNETPQQSNNVDTAGNSQGTEQTKVYGPKLESNIGVVAPTEWKTFSNSELGFSFKYPKEWGETSVTQTKAQPKGSEYRVTFTETDEVAISLLTKDYQNDFGKDAPSVWGFVSYDETVAELESFTQPITKAQNFMVYTSVNGLMGEATTQAVVKLDEQPGFSIGIVVENNLDSMVVPNAAEFGLQENGALDALYYSEENAITLITIANSVKNL